MVILYDVGVGFRRHKCTLKVILDSSSTRTMVSYDYD